jgi:nucleoside-diphosphate-sugar epimerase
MKVFVAGGSGVLGARLVPLLVAAGHDVVAMTRTPSKLDQVRATGAAAVLCDVYDAAEVTAAVVDARPDAVVHQLTDLPDDPSQVAGRLAATARIREVGTDHLLAAAAAAGVGHVVAQSIAWLIDGGRPPSVVHLERATRAAGGVVLRYGRWYGPGTYFPDEPPDAPHVHVDAAARATVDALTFTPGTYAVTDDGATLVDDT